MDNTFCECRNIEEEPQNSKAAIEKNVADRVKLEEIEYISHYWKCQGEKEKVAENERKLKQHKILMAKREEKVAENEKVRSLEKELELNNFIEQFNHENPDKFKQNSEAENERLLQHKIIMAKFNSRFAKEYPINVSDPTPSTLSEPGKECNYISAKMPRKLLNLVRKVTVIVLLIQK